MSEAKHETAEAKRGLVAKLAEVMGALSRLPKTGWNDRQSYHYVTEADVMDAIRSGLAERHVMILQDVREVQVSERESKQGGVLRFVSLRVHFSAHDGDTGETLDLGTMPGESMDSGDKAIYKAITGAVKYFLLKLFKVSSGDDPEAEKKPIHRERAGSGAASAESGPVFPWGDGVKGTPIRGGPRQELHKLIAGLQKSIEDPTKERYRAKNQALKTAAEAELQRQDAEAAALAKLAEEGAKRADPATGAPTSAGVARENADTMKRADKRKAQAEKLAASLGIAPSAIGERLRKRFDVASFGAVTDAQFAAVEAELRAEHAKPAAQALYEQILAAAAAAEQPAVAVRKWLAGNSVHNPPAGVTPAMVEAFRGWLVDLTAPSAEPGAEG